MRYLTLRTLQAALGFGLGVFIFSWHKQIIESTWNEILYKKNEGKPQI